MNPILSNLSGTVKFPGVYRKLGTPHRQNRVNELLRGYLDASTKASPTVAPTTLDPRSEEYVSLIRSGKAPLRAGIDYTSVCPGVYYFGHVRTALPDRGSAAERTEAAIEYWARSVGSKTKKGYHLLFSVDPRIVLAFAQRNIPADAVLLSAALQTVDEYAARFHSLGALGGAAGVHFDRYHPHVHLLLHPRTRDGHGINLSAMSPAVVDGRCTRIDYQGVLHTAFHRHAQRLQTWVAPQPASAQQPTLAAQWLLARELSPGASASEVRAFLADPDWLARSRDSLPVRRDAFLKLKLGAEQRDRYAANRETFESALDSADAGRSVIRQAAQTVLSTQLASVARPVLPLYGPGIAAATESRSLSYMAGRTALEGSPPQQLLEDSTKLKNRAAHGTVQRVAKEDARRDQGVKREKSIIGSFMDLISKRRGALNDLREAARTVGRATINALSFWTRRLPFHLSEHHCKERILPTPSELAERCAASLETAAHVVREQFRPLDLSTEVGVPLCPHRAARRVTPAPRSDTRPTHPPAQAVAAATPHVGFRPLSAETRARAAALLAEIEARFERERAEHDLSPDR